MDDQNKSVVGYTTRTGAPCPVIVASMMKLRFQVDQIGLEFNNEIPRIFKP